MLKLDDAKELDFMAEGPYVALPASAVVGRHGM
jgi:hypothetical protein